jgi:hypothetical protein
MSRPTHQPESQLVNFDKRYTPSCLTLRSLHSAGTQSPSKRYDHIAESTLGSPWPLSSLACKELKQPHRYRTQKLHYGRIAVNPSRVSMQPISHSVSPANWMLTSVNLIWTLDKKQTVLGKLQRLTQSACIQLTVTRMEHTVSLSTHSQGPYYILTGTHNRSTALTLLG